MLETSLTELAQSARRRIDEANAPEELEAVRVEVLGRKGTLAQISKDMGKVVPEERAKIGKLLNSAKNELEALLEARQKAFADAALAERLKAEWLDLTLPAPGIRPGSLHPLTQVQKELEELFISMGFTLRDCPEVETADNNFDA